MIYHIVSHNCWQAALSQGFYEADSLATEGFIHASNEAQVKGVLERYYQNKSDLLLLHIDESKLTAELKYELAPSVKEEFPHIFGRLNIDAVIKAIPPMITWDDFEKIDIRIGTIIAVADFPNARKPSYQLTIDFGEAGVKKSSAQITTLYLKEELTDKQVIAVINFPPKQIANFYSECLVLGVYNENKEVVLLQPTMPVKNGCKIG